MSKIVGYCIFWELKYHKESNENVKKVMEMHAPFWCYRTILLLLLLFFVLFVFFSLSLLFSLVKVFKNNSLREFPYIWQTERNGYNGDKV